MAVTAKRLLVLKRMVFSCLRQSWQVNFLTGRGILG
jgi:hypothetical protein